MKMQEQKQNQQDFADHLGLVFQIKDDIFDYTSSEKEIGKPVGNDIREGKITLPLIYALNNCTEKERETIIDLIKTKKDKEESIQKITQFAIEKGGIKYAEEKMKEYKKEAMKKIEIIEKQDIKKSLEELIQHVIERKN